MNLLLFAGSVLLSYAGSLPKPGCHGQEKQAYIKKSEVKQKNRAVQGIVSVRW